MTRCRPRATPSERAGTSLVSVLPAATNAPSPTLIGATSEGSVLNGNLEHEYRRATINTFGGGVVEVLRGLVATHGLGMPTHR